VQCNDTEGSRHLRQDKSKPCANDFIAYLPFSLRPNRVKVIFVTPEGEKIPVVGAVGDNLLDLAHANDVELEGACEASLACSTCHVILEPHVYDSLPEPSDEENDMLDLAFGLTETYVCLCLCLCVRLLAEFLVLRIQQVAPGMPGAIAARAEQHDCHSAQRHKEHGSRRIQAQASLM